MYYQSIDAILCRATVYKTTPLYRRGDRKCADKLLTADDTMRSQLDAPRIMCDTIAIQASRRRRRRSLIHLPSLRGARHIQNSDVNDMLRRL